MMQFKGFKPEAMKKIQGTLGFQGYAEDFDKYLEDNPDKKATMDSYNKKAIEMRNGGIVMGYANGGTLGSNLVTGQGEFDADGVFGDPRRLRQDLNFDPATGTYTPVGAMAGPLAKGSIPGMGLDNFGPGGVDPRTGTSDMRDRSFQPDPRGPVPVPQASSVSIGQEMINQAYNPSLPYGGAVSAVGTLLLCVILHRELLHPLLMILVLR